VKKREMRRRCVAAGGSCGAKRMGIAVQMS
jgi:hypothetical protein